MWRIEITCDTWVKSCVIAAWLPDYFWCGPNCALSISVHEHEHWFTIAKYLVIYMYVGRSDYRGFEHTSRQNDFF